MWLGNSLLWNWMDRNLVAPAAGARTQTPEPVGSIWLLHSGAFYYAEKTLLAGAAIFGVGWGLAGFCPGPVLVGAAAGLRDAWVFVPAMLAGGWIAGRVFPR